MKHGQTHFWGGSIYYGCMLIVLTVFTFFSIACHQEEKKQRAPLQAIDTLQNGQPRKAKSGTREAFPGGDTIQRGCQLVQGQAESLLEEYHQSTTTKARRRQIIVELKKLELEWKRMDCEQVFGYMIPHIPSPTGAGSKIKK
jgi:hypothetical protein